MTNLSTSILHTKPVILSFPSAASNEILAKVATKSVKTDSIVEVTTETKLDRAISKQFELIRFMQRPEGIVIYELMKLTNWQSHSIRGWISGSLGKKLSLVVTRLKSNAGETCYRIQSVASLS